MEGFVRAFSTQQGDILQISFSEETNLLSKEAISHIGDIKLMGIELLRGKGTNTIGANVLHYIEESVSEVFSLCNNVMIVYYCDFISPIPKTNKNAMPPQEYRSRLFENMFRRYIKQKRIRDIRLSVITVSGIDETYYFHLIYRDTHAMQASIIGSDIKDGYSK